MHKDSGQINNIFLCEIQKAEIAARPQESPRSGHRMMHTRYRKFCVCRNEAEIRSFRSEPGLHRIWIGTLLFRHEPHHGRHDEPHHDCHDNGHRDDHDDNTDISRSEWHVSDQGRGLDDAIH